MSINLFICGIHAPLNTYASFIGTRLPFSVSSCAGIHFSFLTTMFSGQWTAAFLAANRFVATIFPHHYAKYSKNRVAVGCISYSWIVSAVINVPPLFNIGGLYRAIPPWFGCGLQPDGASIVSTLSAVIGVYIPLVVVCGCYVGIFIRSVGIKCRNRVNVESAKVAVKTKSDSSQRRSAVTKMLFACAVWYCVCYFPHSILITSFFNVYQRNPTTQLWIRSLSWCGYVGNPFIFFAMSEEYRHGARTLWGLLFLMRPARTLNNDELKGTSHMNTLTLPATKPSFP
ncbi:galanin receptor 2a-like [Paramacrobiotus metropolitanus]|uniref:galanin receptor 2a-like n=1 Tax=Paramacrobiotus metropolitanus TaxID=2943436 RepID=UPI002445CB04|nr:galanin receptor 2a-like [Paramacrobiotus metropolitanus]